VKPKASGPTDPGILRFLSETAAFYPDNAVDFSMVEQRAFYDALCRHFRKPRPEGVAVVDATIAGPTGPIPVRRYAPSQSDAPRLLYLHGGGYVLGSLDSHDDICAELSDRARVRVIAVHYRLAPEHRFPAALDDVLAVYSRLIEEERGMLTVAGDSAGGNLAAALSLHVRDHGLPVPGGQVLIYPALGGDMSRGSYVERAHAPGLSTADVAWYGRTYLGDAALTSRSRGYAYPLQAADHHRLPAAFLLGCEWDPLRDDVIDYARALVAAGVPVRVRIEPQLVHAFLRARHMSDPARNAFTAIVEAVAALAHCGRLPH
jgi:acetyl esterase